MHIILIAHAPSRSYCICIDLCTCSSGILCILMCTHELVSAHEMSHVCFSLHLWSWAVECKVSPNSYSHLLPLCGLGLLCLPPLAGATVKHLTLFTRRTLNTYIWLCNTHALEDNKAGSAALVSLFMSWEQSRSGHVLKQYNTDTLP